MAGSCKDYRAWHLGNLSDPTEAAHFLIACLEDAVEHNLPAHFLKAVTDVRKIHGAKLNPFIFILDNVAEKEHQVVLRQVAEIMMKYMEKGQPEHHDELQLT